MLKHFKPHPAQSAGLITNYRCAFRCKHCLYCSSPEIEEDIEESTLLEIIDQIDLTLGSIPLHIGGGEPLIHFNLVNGGLNALYDQGMKSGFEPDPKGYVSPCHLCLDLRLHMYLQKQQYEELYPNFFYEDLHLLNMDKR